MTNEQEICKFLSSSCSDTHSMWSVYTKKGVQVKELEEWASSRGYTAVPVRGVFLLDTVAAFGTLHDRSFVGADSIHGATYVRHALALDERRSKFAPVVCLYHT